MEFYIRLNIHVRAASKDTQIDPLTSLLMVVRYAGEEISKLDKLSHQTDWLLKSHAAYKRFVATITEVYGKSF